jgi:plastocyanin
MEHPRVHLDDIVHGANRGATLRSAARGAQRRHDPGAADMRKIWHLPGVLALVVAAPVHAASLAVSVTDSRAQPVPEAVVTVLPRTQARSPAHRRMPDARTIDQKDLMFMPYIEVFRPGDAVVFRNSDRTRHHVYSFSPGKSFEFVLAPGESSAPMKLDKPGVIAVGCNIHDQMATYLYVSDAPWIARSGDDGRVVFDDLPAGSYDVRVWHPRLRPGRPDLAQLKTIVGTSAVDSLAFTLSLLPDARRQFDREHTRY